MLSPLELAFWLAVAVIVYTYVGYGAVLWMLVKVRDLLGFSPRQPDLADPEVAAYEPEVTLVVAAYNEERDILQKLENSLAQDYPKDKLKLLFVTDGSTDRTPQLLLGYPGVKLLHRAGRAGKIAAMNRAMKHVETPIVIFSDANAMLNREAVRNIVKHYADPTVGAVSGEKRIRAAEADAASGAGEGLYWRYESALKHLDARLHTVVGAAGELFSLRTDLFHPSEPDTLLDDFMLTLRVAQQGYRVAYATDANATELPSATVEDEFKRKVRICAGGFQSMARLLSLLNPRHGWTTFQYVSHRVLRWAVTPPLLLVAFALNFVLGLTSPFYAALYGAQTAFWLLALAGWRWQDREVKVKGFFVPFYFAVMNVAAFFGFARWLRGQQSVNWERAARATA
ncbi:MAG: glycosyltransferase family 2 protein [Bacteroidota bacterium]